MYLWHTQEGDTAIMAAAGRGHRDIVRMLLASPGIDLRATDYVSVFMRSYYERIVAVL